MNNNKIKICNTTIHPNEIANLALPMPAQYSCSPLYMPIKVINGAQKGPCLVIFSGLKGTELNGLEITNKIGNIIDPKKMCGTIIAIPVVNTYGLTHYPITLPTGNSLASCFPGNENGGFGERIAYVFTHEILKKADYCIELATGDVNHNILPQVYCNFDNPSAKKLARTFDTPVITNFVIKENPLRQTTEELQIPLLVYQAGEAMRFDENAITLGVNGIKNIMFSIGMLTGQPSKEVNPICSQDEEWIIAHHAGIFHVNISLGQTIKKNESIGTIMDPFGIDIIETVKSPQEGIVVGINASPLIYEGLKIIKIASFLDYDKAENVIEAWDQKQPDSYIN